MAKDFLVGVGIGLVGGAAFKAAVGGSIRRIDNLGKKIEAPTWVLSMSTARTAAGLYGACPTYRGSRPNDDHDDDCSAPGRFMVCQRNDSAVQHPWVRHGGPSVGA